MSEDKTAERKLLLKRLFLRSALYGIGRSLDIEYFKDFASMWDVDDDRASFEIASRIDDQKLKALFEEYRFREWEIFRGHFYAFENGKLRFGDSWRQVQTAVAEMKKKYGKNAAAVLTCLAQAPNGCNASELRKLVSDDADPSEMVSELAKLNVAVAVYKSKRSVDWGLLEETKPAVLVELGKMPEKTTKEALVVSATTEVAGVVDPLEEERRTVSAMDAELDAYLNDLFGHRLDETVAFGKSFSISYIAQYLKELFGPVLFFDTLLSVTQQYGLADVDIVHEKGRTGMRTGWNLSLFGEPGTGKSFSVRDMILGKPDAKIPAHGIPGRNRYAGGMTPARFIRVGQAYSGRVFNFIVPEFNDWFKYKGMVEPLKLAMERGVIKYETQRETIGPYRFSSFFSVNYNVAVSGRGFEVTVQDPNFSAIEDRMLCRLHRLTKQRFVEIAESQMRLAFGEVSIDKEAQHVRDHVALVYAIETGHPLAVGKFGQKPVMLTSKAQETFARARKAILEEIPEDSVRFSARLEDRAIRFACAASLLSYFQSDSGFIPISDEALKYAIQLYVEEASVRSRDAFAPELVLAKLG